MMSKIDLLLSSSSELEWEKASANFFEAILSQPATVPAINAVMAKLETKALLTSRIPSRSASDSSGSCSFFMEIN